MFLETFCSGPASTNAILLACEATRMGVIIDAPPGSGEILLKRTMQENIDLEMLLLTHSHWDHFADMAFLKKELGIPLYVHSLDAKNLQEPGADGLPLLIEISKVEPDHFLEEGQKLLLGDLVIEVLHTPGHSPGCVCFYLPEEKTLISGDTLFRGSMGKISFPSSNPQKMWESLKKLSQLPKETRVIPGHGEETTIQQEYWLANAKNYFGG